MGLRTGVRLPSAPLHERYTNTYPDIKTAVFKNMFGISLRFQDFETQENADDNITFSKIIELVYERYKLKISRSCISSVKAKCKIDKFEKGNGKIIPILKSQKEKAVLEIFRELKII